MKHFKIILFDEAINDIQNGIDYYKYVSPAIAVKFYKAVNNSFKELKKNPYFQIRYDNVRMLVIKGFPYALHFVVNEEAESIIIYGIINTSMTPETSYFFNK